MRRGIPLLALLALSLSPLLVLDAAESDGRAGVVLDLQGTVVVRALGEERFAPLTARDVLWPGQTVKVLARGANAVELSLTGGGAVVLGPGAMAVVESGSALRLLRGEAEITNVTLTAPGDFEAVVKGTSFLRAEDKKTVLLEAPPRWLEGYRQSTSTEWLGSLIAEVDGRSVPLDIGFHQVNVVIRDQIAETTITESFVNNTGATLEGEFNFPLPAGASVSGFGMWIDDELVMADIVERQRAREIYEDIKRRKKDPGLLEWSGGNLFKARVFPIPPHGEKRIRIRYTQVLPLEDGTRVRYRYPLRSEMLRHHPLRQLEIRVSTESVIPLRGASSPTHEVSVEASAHHALVTFDAESYTPQRDFEAVFDLQSVPPLTVVPHRRGEDGYFMLLFTPPAPVAPPKGKRPPLDLLILADTSGSMTPEDRQAQAAFIEALLALLGDDDHFRLAAIDRGLTWIAKDETPPDAAEAVLDELAKRPSLGWTDLEGTLTEALSGTSHVASIVYLGDGIGTKEPPDAGKLAARIRRIPKRSMLACHAVSTGSSYEAGVLSAIASLGGGTVRAVGDQPATSAAALLRDMASPQIGSLTLSIEGVRTARVYPERLPSCTYGSQQVILGRFLPTVATARGMVVIRGASGPIDMEWKAPFVLEPGGTGNSFLPRLWARRHLDALLADGINDANRDDIIEFSRRFSIITPLTSFLVLESDADREFYGVKRTVGMRDGERFFAAARDRTRAEARRAQMRMAKRWEDGLRAQARAEIRRMARPESGGPGPDSRYPGGGFGFGFGGGGSGAPFGSESSQSELILIDVSGDGVDRPLGEEERADFEDGEDMRTPARIPLNSPPPPALYAPTDGPYSGPMDEFSEYNYRSVNAPGYFGEGDERGGEWMISEELRAAGYDSARLLSRLPTFSSQRT